MVIVLIIVFGFYIGVEKFLFLFSDGIVETSFIFSIFFVIYIVIFFVCCLFFSVEERDRVKYLKFFLFLRVE